MSESRKKNKVLGNSMMYTVSAMLTKAVSFIMMPIYTNYISPDQYGIVRVINNFISVATYIVGLSLYSALMRFTSQYKNDTEKQRKLYGSILTFVSFMGLISIALCFLLRDVLEKLIFEGIPFFPYVLVGLIALFFRCQANIHTHLLQGRQEGKRLLIVHAVGCVLTVVINLALLFGLKLEGLSVIISMLIVDMMYMIVMLIELKHDNLLEIGIDMPILREVLRYSVPLVPHQISTSIATLVSTVILKDRHSLSTVGLYNIASSFSVAIDEVQSSVNRAFMPWFFETMDSDSDAKKTIGKFTSGMLRLYSVMYLGVGLFAQEFVLLFTEKSYALSWTPVPILVAAYSVKSIYYLYTDVLLYYKDPSKKLFIATVTGSLLDILLSAWLAGSMGMYGIALAFLIAKIVVQAIVYLIARPYAPNVGFNHWEMSKIVGTSLVFMAVGLIFSYTRLQETLSLLNFLYKLLIFALYLFLLYRSNPVAAKNIFHMIKKKFVKAKG
ncbi:MAG: lipopolysaccharide biosynthesis protein [Christensenellales bacterium]|jgi:O-antigen/teichoic acid export membrane protein